MKELIGESDISLNFKMCTISNSFSERQLANNHIRAFVLFHLLQFIYLTSHLNILRVFLEILYISFHSFLNNMI